MAFHILVLEGDVDVRSVLVEMLEHVGFTPIPAESDAAMRDILAAEALTVDAVVLDYAVPGGPRAELALRAKSLRLPVVMISGSLEAMKFAGENGLQLLHKPFGTKELLNAISEALESGEFGQRGDRGPLHSPPG